MEFEHKMTRIACITALSVLALALGITVDAQLTTQPIARTGPAGLPPEMIFHALPVGQKAPDFSAYTPTGRKVSLSQFKGKVVVLDFWASWCGPCQVSMPGLEKIYAQIKKKGVVVLSLNTWDQKPDFEAWVKKNSGTTYHFNFVRDPAEGDHDAIRKASIAKRLYKVVGIPTMYVIDRKGNVAGSFVGSGNEAGLVTTLGKIGLKAKLPTETQ